MSGLGLTNAHRKSLLKIRPQTDLKVSAKLDRSLSLTDERPPTHYKDTLVALAKEFQSLYGDIPLWITFSSTPIAESWLTGKTRSAHEIRIYGDKAYVKEYLTRLETRLAAHAAPSNKQAESKPESQRASPIPRDLQKAAQRGNLLGDLIGAGGLLGLAFGFLMLWQRNKDSNLGVNHDKSLGTAMATVSLIDTKQALLHEAETEEGWEFLFTDYQVHTDRQGHLISVARRA